MFKKLIAGALLATLALSALAPVAAAAEPAAKSKPTVDAVTRLVNYSANNNNQLSTLLTAATCDYFDGAIVDTLKTAKHTLFAPRNSAFRDLGKALGLGDAGINASNVCKVDEVLKLDGALATILTYHVYAEGKVGFDKAKSLRGASVAMLSKEKAKIGGQQRNVVKIAGAKVVVKNIRSANAVTHVVNKVMVPPTIKAALAK
jgi:uncharacterized surface protein with fasciclin (FAS1) repeats